LDHPAIVRLIEYFVADAEVLLVMELLQGPSLGEKLRSLGRFSETFAVRCLRHMLKALFCCHCHGIAHNDVSEENFRFETSRADAALRMVDFGLSEMSAQESAANADGAATAQAQAGHCPVRGLYVQKRDIWSVGTILYEMLAGSRLFPTTEAPSGGLPDATNPSYVPSRLRALSSASEQARDLLAKMLEPSTDRRIAAQEALQHPLVVQSYALAASEAPLFEGTATATVGFSGIAGVGLASLTSRHRRRLAGCVPALRAFAKAPRLKRLALLVAAHLLGDEVGGLRWLFRFLARDAWLVEESVFASALLEAGEELPKDFSMLFRCADLSGSGALNFVEFMAAMMANLPEVYCSHSSLKAVFHFFDSGHGILQGEQLHLLFPARPEEECALMIRQSCGKDSMSFLDFRRVMTPANWKPSASACSLAKWADVPDVTSPVLGPKPKLLKEPQRCGSSSDPERECQEQVRCPRCRVFPSAARRDRMAGDEQGHLHTLGGLRDPSEAGLPPQSAAALLCGAARLQRGAGPGLGQLGLRPARPAAALHSPGGEQGALRGLLLHAQPQVPLDTRGRLQRGAQGALRGLVDPPGALPDAASLDQPLWRERKMRKSEDFRRRCQHRGRCGSPGRLRLL